MNNVSPNPYRKRYIIRIAIGSHQVESVEHPCVSATPMEPRTKRPNKDKLETNAAT